MEEEVTLDIRELFYAIKKRMKLILGITIGVTVLVGVLSFFVIKPTYEAKTSIIVGKPQATEKDGTQNSQYNDVMMYQNLIKTYSTIAQSKLVAENASEKLNGKITAENLQKIITVTTKEGTQILEISAQSKSAQEAVDIVEASSSSFVEQSKKVFPTGGDIQIMDKPELPDKPVKPRKALNVAIAFLIGLMGSMGLVFVLEYMDSTIKTEYDVEKYLELPVLGIIPKNVQ